MEQLGKENSPKTTSSVVPGEVPPVATEAVVPPTEDTTGARRTLLEHAKQGAASTSEAPATGKESVKKRVARGAGMGGAGFLGAMAASVTPANAAGAIGGAEVAATAGSAKGFLAVFGNLFGGTELTVTFGHLVEWMTGQMNRFVTGSTSGKAKKPGSTASKSVGGHDH